MKRRILMGLTGITMLMLAGSASAQTDWVCVGLNSTADVQSFLSGVPAGLKRVTGSAILDKNSAAEAKIVAMPPADGVPAFEVYFPTTDSTFNPTDVPFGVACPN